MSSLIFFYLHFLFHFGGVSVLYDSIRTMMGMVLFVALGVLIYLYFPFAGSGNGRGR